MSLAWIPEHLGNLLLHNSLAGAVLVGLVLAAGSLFRHKISPQWMFCLWIVVILRFLSPWSIPSPVSLLNLIGSELIPVGSLPTQQNTVVGNGTSDSSNPVHLTPSLIQSNAAELYQSPDAEPADSLSTATVLVIIWAAGATAVGLFILIHSLYFWLILHRDKPVIRQDVLEILEQCKEHLGICTLLCIVQTRRIHTPALMGFIRPRLVFPDGLIDTISPGQLRHILLHELAHLKRHDIVMGWAMAAVQVLHWFNPLVWVAARQMHRDRELACDADVLSVLERDQARNYGGTLLTLMETMSNRSLGIGLSGIMEHITFVRRRIEMIALYRPEKTRWSHILTAAVAALLIAVTGARNSSLAAEKTAERDMQSDAPAVVKTIPSAAADPNAVSPASNDKPVDNSSSLSAIPAILRTVPESFANDVDPATQAISVTFNRLMKDGSWSWTGGGETYPEIVGKPGYSSDKKTCQLNVKLQPGKVYWVGINSPSHKNFKSEAGVPAKWYVILFATKDAEGKPTSIPADLLSQARKINKESSVAPSKPAEVAYDDGKSAGKSSMAGGAHFVKFQGENERQVVAVRLFASRYGTPQPPKENFKVILLDGDNQAIEEMEFPYSLIKRGDPTWYNIKFPKPVNVPATFYVAVDFNPEQTKGVYVNYDAAASGHSFTGSTTDNVELKAFDKGDWMIRAMVLN